MDRCTQDHLHCNDQGRPRKEAGQPDFANNRDVVSGFIGHVKEAYVHRGSVRIVCESTANYGIQLLFVAILDTSYATVITLIAEVVYIDRFRTVKKFVASSGRYPHTAITRRRAAGKV